jgi:hypothetical protein
MAMKIEMATDHYHRLNLSIKRLDPANNWQLMPTLLPSALADGLQTRLLASAKIQPAVYSIANSIFV